IHYVNGVKNGPVKEYNPNGSIQLEATYLDNNFDGEYIQYYENGQVMTKGQYEAAVKHGLWIYYAPDGQIKAQELYDHGKLEKQQIEEGFEKKLSPVEPEKIEEPNLDDLPR